MTYINVRNVTGVKNIPNNPDIEIKYSGECMNDKSKIDVILKIGSKKRIKKKSIGDIITLLSYEIIKIDDKEYEMPKEIYYAFSDILGDIYNMFSEYCITDFYMHINPIDRYVSVSFTLKINDNSADISFYIKDKHVIGELKFWNVDIKNNYEEGEIPTLRTLLLDIKKKLDKAISDYESVKGAFKTGEEILENEEIKKLIDTLKKSEVNAYGEIEVHYTDEKGNIWSAYKTPLDKEFTVKLNGLKFGNAKNIENLAMMIHTYMHRKEIPVKEIKKVVEEKPEKEKIAYGFEIIAEREECITDYAEYSVKIYDKNSKVVYQAKMEMYDIKNSFKNNRIDKYKLPEPPHYSLDDVFKAIHHPFKRYCLIREMYVKYPNVDMMVYEIKLAIGNRYVTIIYTDAKDYVEYSVKYKDNKVDRRYEGKNIPIFASFLIQNSFNNVENIMKSIEKKIMGEEEKEEKEELEKELREKLMKLDSFAKISKYIRENIKNGRYVGDIPYKNLIRKIATMLEGRFITHRAGVSVEEFDKEYNIERFIIGNRRIPEGERKLVFETLEDFAKYMFDVMANGWNVDKVLSEFRITSKKKPIKIHEFCDRFIEKITGAYNVKLSDKKCNLSEQKYLFRFTYSKEIQEKLGMNGFLVDIHNECLIDEKKCIEQKCKDYIFRISISEITLNAELKPYKEKVICGVTEQAYDEAVYMVRDMMLRIERSAIQEEKKIIKEEKKEIEEEKKIYTARKRKEADIDRFIAFLESQKLRVIKNATLRYRAVRKTLFGEETKIDETHNCSTVMFEKDKDTGLLDITCLKKNGEKEDYSISPSRIIVEGTTITIIKYFDSDTYMWIIRW